MIRSLEIRGLVVIDHAELTPAAGLTAITGETGAGKTVLAQALALLAGGRADASAVRPGARHALVQAELGLPPGYWDGLDEDDPALALRELVDDEREVVLARRVPAEGRARALIDGQVSAREAVASVARAAMRFSGQGEQRRLLSPAAQLAALDAFAGEGALAMAGELRRRRSELRGLDRALAGQRERADAAERERAELEELIAATEAAGLDPAEEAALTIERERLRHAARLGEAAAAAAEALAPLDGEGAVDAASAAAGALAPLVEIDPALREPHEAATAALLGLQEAASTLRGYLDALEAEPGRLDQIEGRLEIYHRLGRRYGPGTQAVLERATAARDRVDELDAVAGDDAGLADRRAAVARAAGELAHELGLARRAAAPELARAAGQELARLAMPEAALRIEVRADDAEVPSGACTFWLRPNPGLPEAPLADSASGGELSRVLLALHGVTAAGDGASWIFDEVDAGIGGVTATAVGERLAAMAHERQVIVITHLPQIAAQADRHYRLVKEAGDGATVTRIEPLADEELLGELCRMLGAPAGDVAARRHAERLLASGPG